MESGVLERGECGLRKNVSLWRTEFNYTNYLEGGMEAIEQGYVGCSRVRGDTSVWAIPFGLYHNFRAPSYSTCSY